MTDAIAPFVVEQLHDLTLNYSNIFNLSLFLFNFTLERFHVNRVYINHTQSGIDLSDGLFHYYISNLTFDCIGNTNFNTVPMLFFGAGYGLFNLSRLNTTLKMKFGLGNNLLPNISIESSKVDINVTNLQMKFSGTNDVYTLLEMVQNFSIPMIVDLIGGEMKKETKKSLSDTINGLLEGLPHSMRVPGTHIDFDFGFLLPPTTKEGYMPLALYGNSSCGDEKACIPYQGKKPDPPKDQPVFGGMGSFQVLLSDYMLDTLFISAFEDQLLKANITAEMVRNMTNGTISLDTDLFGIFIPIMREKYGPHKEIFMKVNFSQPPTVDITTKDLTRKLI